MLANSLEHRHELLQELENYNTLHERKTVQSPKSKTASSAFITAPSTSGKATEELKLKRSLDIYKTLTSGLDCKKQQIQDKLYHDVNKSIIVHLYYLSCSANIYSL